VNSIRPTVDNPFLIHDPNELNEVIRKTADALDLSQYCEILQHGAQLARDKPTALAELHTSKQISPEEKQSLQVEELIGFWGQPQALKGVIILATLAGIIQG
jgi:hypothetical protein